MPSGIVTRHRKKTSDKTAASAAVKTQNGATLHSYHIAFEGRAFLVEAVEIEVNGNHYTFLGEDGEPSGVFPTARTGVVKLS